MSRVHMFDRARKRSLCGEIALRAVSVGLAVLLLAPRGGSAQAPPASPASSPAAGPDSASGSVCLGFRFGVWAPPLDWRAAGHPGSIEETAPLVTSSGTAWAMGIDRTRDASADSTMLLVPAWWPAGVVVRWPAGDMAPADTIVGRATALVADGRVTPSTSQVRGWRVACRPKPGA